MFLSSAAMMMSLLAGPAPLAHPEPALADTARTVWQIDLSHSDISFRIRHFVSRVRGTFTDWSGTIRSDSADWRDAVVDVTIQAASIDTRNERRDTDLRSSNFFDAANNPTITFRSTSVSIDGTSLKIAGDLTMHGVTKPIVLEGSYLGTAPSPQGRPRAGFEARTTINRLDFGVSWNRVVEGAGVMLGDDVEIEIALEAVRQP